MWLSWRRHVFSRQTSHRTLRSLLDFASRFDMNLYMLAKEEYLVAFDEQTFRLYTPPCQNKCAVSALPLAYAVCCYSMHGKDTQASIRMLIANLDSFFFASCIHSLPSKVYKPSYLPLFSLGVRCLPYRFLRPRVGGLVPYSTCGSVWMIICGEEEYIVSTCS
jgi:hypothetical protein